MDGFVSSNRRFNALLSSWVRLGRVSGFVLFVLLLLSTQTTQSPAHCNSAKKARYKQQEIIPAYIMVDAYLSGYYLGLNWFWSLDSLCWDGLRSSGYYGRKKAIIFSFRVLFLVFLAFWVFFGEKKVMKNMWWIQHFESLSSFLWVKDLMGCR